MKQILLVGDEMRLKSGIGIQLRMLRKCFEAEGHEVSNFGYTGLFDSFSERDEVVHEWDGVDTCRYGPSQLYGGLMTMDQVNWLTAKDWDVAVVMMPDHSEGNMNFIKYIRMVLMSKKIKPKMVLYFVWDEGLFFSPMITEYMVKPELLELFDLVVPVSEASDIVARLTNTENMTGIVHHAVDETFWRYPTDEERAAARAKRGFAEGETVVLWTGRPMPRKNLNVALRLFKELEVHLDVRLLLHTNPEDEWVRNLENVVQAFGPDSVVWEKRQDLNEEEFRDLFWASDACINTSCAEGFGVPTAQALCCGLKCVCSDTNGSSTIEIAMGNDGSVIVVDVYSDFDIVSNERALFGRAELMSIDEAFRVFEESTFERSYDVSEVARRVFGMEKFNTKWTQILEEVTS